MTFEDMYFKICEQYYLFHTIYKIPQNIVVMGEYQEPN